MVALAGLVLLAVSTPLYGALTVWFVTLEREFNWTRTELSRSFFIARLFLPTLVVGYLSDRFGPRRVIVPGLFVLASSWVLFGLVQNLWMFYAVVAIMGAGASLCGWVPLVTMINRWFVRRRATAIAIASMLSPIGAFGLVPLIAWSVEPDSGWPGWRLIAIVVSGCVLVVAALAFARLRNRPEDMGLLADGGPPAMEQRSLSTIQALRTRAFWFLVVGDGFASMTILDISTTFLHPLALYRNLPPGEAIFAVYIHSYVSIGFYLVGGLVGDRIHKSIALALFTVLQAAGLTVLAFAGSMPVLYLASVLLGIGAGGRAPLNVAILADYFGLDSFGKTLALFFIFSWLPVAVGSPLLGWLYDSRWLYDDGGLYVIVFLLLAGLTLVGVFFYLKARPPQPPDTVAPQTVQDRESAG